MTKNEVSDQECLQMGRSILLLGLKRAMAILQAQTDTLQTQLSVPAPGQNGNGDVAIRPAMQRTMAMIEEAEIVHPNTRKSKKSNAPGIKAYWAQFSPEERQREMARRARVGRRRRKAAGL